MQKKAWEREYRAPNLITKHDKPQNEVLKYLKWLKKFKKFDVGGRSVLDLGSGSGRNSNYLAQMGALVTGYEISKTAVSIAKERARKLGVNPSYEMRSFGEPFPIPDDSIELILDVISSNSLTNKERTTYLAESRRVLRPGGQMLVKALLLEGDQNAKQLLVSRPGSEEYTYVLPTLGVIERIFPMKEFVTLYEGYFKTLKIEKRTSYIPMNNRLYKRRFIVAYLEKR